MESTGAYGIAAYEVLESRGLDVVLAKGRTVRTKTATSMVFNGGAARRPMSMASVRRGGQVGACVTLSPTPTLPFRHLRACRQSARLWFDRPISEISRMQCPGSARRRVQKHLRSNREAPEVFGKKAATIFLDGAALVYPCPKLIRSRFALSVEGRGGHWEL
jgi:hypothetical protein